MAAGLCSPGALSPAHPKGPEAKDDDDEVDNVSQEHESINVSGCAVLGVQDVMEETSQGPVHALGPEGGGVGLSLVSLGSSHLPLGGATPRLVTHRDRQKVCSQIPTAFTLSRARLRFFSL